MNIYIDADAVIKTIAEQDMFEAQMEYATASDDFEDYAESARELLKDLPTTDLDDYIPKAYYEKVVEELCRKHTEEIASMPSVVRCKECDMSEVYQNDSSGVMARYCRAFAPNRMVADDDFCSYGERKDNE